MLIACMCFFVFISLIICYFLLRLKGFIFYQCLKTLMYAQVRKQPLGL